MGKSGRRVLVNSAALCLLVAATAHAVDLQWVENSDGCDDLRICAVPDPPDATKLQECECGQEPRGCGDVIAGIGDKDLSDPVHLYTGEFIHTQTDLVVPGVGMDIVFTRKYRSRSGRSDTFGSTDTVPIGHNWDHSYNIFLKAGSINIASVGQDKVTLYDGTGRRDSFTTDSGDVETVDTRFTRPEYFDVIVVEDDEELAMERADGSVWRFFAFSSTAPTTEPPGYIKEMVDRNGNTISFEYTGGKLTSIIDTVGRALTLTYVGSNWLESVTDHAGRLVTYTYHDGSGAGRGDDLQFVSLPSVTQPDGSAVARVWEYTYGTGSTVETTNLLSITDPNGNVVLENVTDCGSDRIIRQFYGGDQYDYIYDTDGGTPPGSSTSYPWMTRVINRGNQVKDLYFDGRGRLAHRVDYTKLVTRTVSDPCDPPSLTWATDPIRDGDPAYFSTVRDFNNDSQMTGSLNGSGVIVETVYDSANVNPRKRGNMLSRTVKDDETSPTIAVTEEWAYDFDLGSGGGCGCGAGGFPTRHIDGRGHAVYFNYDSNGNLVRKWADMGTQQTVDPEDTHEANPQTGDIVLGLWEYDGRGRVIEHTLASNGTGSRVDTTTYYSDTDTGNPGRRGLPSARVVDDGGEALTTTYDYDQFGNLAEIVDPMGHITLREYNAADLPIREQRLDITGLVILAQREWYYDANMNVVREDELILDEAGDVIEEGLLTTITAYDILNNPIIVRQQLNLDDLVPNTNPAPVTIGDWPGGVEFIQTEYDYDGNDNLVLIVKGEAANSNQPTNIITRIYDERNRLYRETVGAGGSDESTTQYNYTDSGQLVERIDGIPESGSLTGAPVTSYVYDGIDRLIGLIDPLENYIVFTLDANGNREAVEHFDVGTTSLAKSVYTFDALDRATVITQHIFGPGLSASTAVTTTVYNPDSSVASADGPLPGSGDTTTYAYDTVNRLALVTDAGGNTTAYEYDDDSRVTAVVRSDLSEVSGGATEVYRTQYAYDTLDRLTDVTEVMPGTLADNVSTLEYDSRGLRLAAVDANTNRREWTYDGLGREIAMRIVMYPEADIVTQQVWDASSRLVAQVDDNGNPTAYAYDALDRLIVTRLADGTMTKVGTGAVSWADPLDLPDLSSFTAAMDPRGNPLTVTDANGSVVATTYDLLDRPTLRSITRATNVMGTTYDVLGSTFEEFTYDGLSRVLTAVNDDTRVTRVYDSLSRVLEETVEVATSPGPPIVYGEAREVSYVYDAAGNITRTNYPGGRIVDATYDALSRIDELEHIGPGGADPTFTVATFKHVGGRVARRTHGNDTEVRITYGNFAAEPSPSGSNLGFGHPRTIVHHNLPATEPLDSFLTRDIGWDRVGNKVFRENSAGGIASLPHEYGYDRADRLVNTEVDGGTIRDQTYELDGVHNRESVSGKGAPDAGPYFRTGTGDDPVNQYSFTPVLDPVYDEEGNLRAFDMDCRSDVNGDHQINGADMSVLMSNFGNPVPPCTSGDANCDGEIDGADLSSLLGQFGRACAYVEINYDYRNRMVKWQGFAESGHTAPADVHEYVYDCFSRRIAKRTDVGSAREREYRYAFGGRSGDALWRLLQMEVTDGEVDPVTYTFVHTSGSVGYIDDVVSMRRESGAGEFLEQDDFWYHQDDLFTVVALTDEDGDVVERYEYQDYGQEHITLADGSTTVSPNAHSGRIESLVGNPFTFTGRELDNETGLILYRTRYLQTVIGRFTTRDTIGVWGDGENAGNAQGYVWSSPLTLVDAFGLAGSPSDPLGPPVQINPDHWQIRTPDDLDGIRGPWWNPYDPLHSDLESILNRAPDARGTLILSCHGNKDIGPYVKDNGVDKPLFPIDLACKNPCASAEDDRKREEWIEKTLDPIKDRFTEVWIYACNCARDDSAKIMQCLADELGIPVVTHVSYCGVGVGDPNPNPETKPGVDQPGYPPGTKRGIFKPGESQSERRRRVR